MRKLSDEELINELTRRFEENRTAFQELKGLNDELLIVNKKLEESESLKSHFISNITNEIVNPFTSIIGLSRAILDVDKENWKKVVSMVALIHSEAFHLDFQLRNIFVAAKIEAGEINPEFVNADLRNLLDGVVGNFTHEARKKRCDIKLVFAIDGYSGVGRYDFVTDPEKFKLILSNLLSNAVNFSYEDSEVIVKITRDADILKVVVHDSGQGISELNQQIIFDRFKRIDSGINSLNRGHGLGLSINKALLDVLNGRIEVVSSLGHGSTFTIFIPEASAAGNSGYASDADEFFFGDDQQVF